MAEPRVPRLELPFFAPDRTGYSILRKNGVVKGLGTRQALFSR